MPVLWTPLGVRLPQPYCKQYPHPPQEAFLWLDCLDAFYGGAAGPGKSSALLAAALQYVDVPGYAAILFRRTMRDLELPGALINRSEEWLFDTDAVWNGHDYRWTFPSGATLSFGYLMKSTDHLRYQSAEFQYIGIDEASQIRPAQLRYMFSRLRKPDFEETGNILGQVPLRFRLASNPGDIAHEYLKKRYILKQTDPKDEEDTPERAARRVFIRARLEDNPSVDQAAYRESLAHLDPAEREQLLNGDWDARMPGDWYFETSHLNRVVELGAQLEQAMGTPDLPYPDGGVVHLGIDWGESTHAVLGWPLEHGGMFIVREYVGGSAEPGRSTEAMLKLRETIPGPEVPYERYEEIKAMLSEGFTYEEVATNLRIRPALVRDIDEYDSYWPWGRARYDAAGVQSQRTFDRIAAMRLGDKAPRKSAIPFGGRVVTTVEGSRKRYKGLGCTYLRRLARRAYGSWFLNGIEVTEDVEGAEWMEGPLPGYLAVSPECPEFMRQLRKLPRDPEDPTGAWLKDDDQHGPDAAVALIAPVAKRYRELAAV